MRSVWLDNEARDRVSALAYVVDRGHVQYAGRLSAWRSNCTSCGRATAAPATTATMCSSTVKSIEAQGFRDPQLHQLAAMLHEGGTHVDNTA